MEDWNVCIKELSSIGIYYNARCLAAHVCDICGHIGACITYDKIVFESLEAQMASNTGAPKSTPMDPVPKLRKMNDVELQVIINDTDYSEDYREMAQIIAEEKLHENTIR